MKREKMKYTVIVKKNTKKSLSERTFCFTCGCFQGGGGKEVVKS